MKLKDKNIYDIISLLKKNELLKKTYNIKENFLINNITYFSKEASKNNLFICKGAKFKEDYLNEAINNGINCYISEIKYDNKTPAIIVKDVRKAMSLAAIFFYENPENTLKLTGITGTKGKTTTAFYIKKILDTYLGHQTGLLSTVKVITSKNNEEESHLTTPESLDLQKMLYNAKDNDLKYLTMEVSSQAYKHNRVFGMKYDIGIFMNIDKDHIGPNEHNSYEEYLSCKSELMKNCETAIIMHDTREFNKIKQIANENAKKVIIIGKEGDDYYLKNVKKEENCFSFDLVLKNGSIEHYTIDQEGRFNIKNAFCAIVTAKEYGIPYEVIKKAIEHITIPGRMNVFNNQKITVIVDYAHNNLSFKELFKSLKKDYPNARVTVVCGSSGSKNQMRRKAIGTMIGKYADKIYLTAEDPQFEETQDICNEVAKYIIPHKKPYCIIEDRTTAIEKAIEQSDKGDIIIVTGKGEEHYQKINGEYEYYESDISVVERMIMNKQS